MSPNPALILRLAFRNLGRNLGRNLTLGTILGLGALLLVTGNSILETASTGTRRAYGENFTGDIMVRQAGPDPVNIFGIELGGIDDYTRAADLPDPEKTLHTVLSVPGVEDAVFLDSCPVMVTAPSFRGSALAFGVDADSYFRFFPHFSLDSGTLPAGTGNWIVLSSAMADMVKSSTGRTPLPGDSFSLTYASGSNFAIRRGILAAVMRHDLDNPAFDRTIWAGHDLLRDLVAGTGSEDAPDADVDDSLMDRSLDDIWGDEGDAEIIETPSLGTTTAREGLKDLRDALPGDSGTPPPPPASGDWQFLLARTAPDAAPGAVVSLVSRDLSRAGLDATAGNWQDAAGPSATWIDVLSAVYNIGFVILLLIIMFIVSNAFMISVMERTREIGAIRALGGPRIFVGLLVGTETMLLTIIAGAIGMGLGLLLVSAIGAIGIPLDNSLLVSMFGSTRLIPRPGAAAMGISAVMVIIMGMLSWITPVMRALALTPVQALSREH